MSLRWLCCALFGTFLPAAHAAPPPPDAHEIVVRMAAQDRVLRERRKACDYDLEITRDKLDDQGNVTSTTRETIIVKGDRRPDFGTRSAPGSSTAAAPEDEAKKASREEPFELLNILDHYTYTLEGEETVDGVLCYRIAFTPKPDMPYANREEKVLNAVAGHLWSAVKDYSLVRNEGALLHPVPVAWIFASLREMDFRFDAMPLPNGDYGPAREQYGYLVSIAFFTLHERDTRRMSNYRPANDAAAKP